MCRTSGPNWPMRWAGFAPPAAMGAFFVGIYDEHVVNANPEGDDHLHERQTICVAINYRSGQHASDRLGTAYLQNAQKIERYEREIIGALHNKPAVIQTANTLLGTEAGDIFLTPLKYRGRGTTMLRDSSWDLGGSVNGAPWLVRVLPFTGLDRVQGVSTVGYIFG